MADELNKLAERVEALMGPDVSVAKAIFAAVHPEKVPSKTVTSGYGWRDDSAGWWLATGEDSRTPRQTIYPPNWLGSLDAAMSLVPEGWELSLHSPDYDEGETKWCAELCPTLAVYEGGCRAQGVYAATPALALTAAALRAREVIAHMAGQEA